MQAFVTEHERCRFVVTSRPAGLDGSNRRTLDVAGLAHAQVQDLEPERAARFIRAWYRAILPADPARAEHEANDLIARIQQSRARGIEEFTKKPILLTALAVVHQTRGNLPERRAELYEHCVRTLTFQWEDVKFRDVSGRSEVFGADDKLLLLERIAKTLHLGGAQVIERDDLFGLVRELPGGTELTKLQVEEALQALAERSGLLVPDGHGFRFRHLTFQEYLTARWLADDVNDQDAIAILAPRLADWPEVAQLTPAYMASNSRQKAVDFVTKLLAAAFAAAGAGERRLAVLEVVARTLRDLNEYSVPDLSAAWETHRDSFLGVLSDPAQPASLACRIAVADMLGKLGDPRLTDEKRWVEVPAGPFVRGARNAYKGTPVRTISVSTFRVQRWTVTVEEFRAFVEDGGYAREEWWDAAGWRWRENDGVFEPGRWSSQLSEPRNRPVTFVSWWEADAYCRWRTKQEPDLPDGWEIRLPTDAEWEKAARGGKTMSDGEPNPDERREYAWGSKWDPARASWGSDGEGLRSVGCHPAGNGPYGTWDNCGNVWEWSRDWFAYYPEFGADRDPVGPDVGTRKAARGGSFGSVVVDVSLRVSYRYVWGPASFRNDNLGFRCVSAPVR